MPICRRSSVLVSDVYRRGGLKWVPFLLAGPSYALPDWYYKSPEAQGYVCLEQFLSYVQPLRDRFDFDYLSDQQIADGGLGRHRALVLLWGNVSEAATWRAVAEWVKQGGLLLRPGDLGPLRTVEGAAWPEAALAATADAGKGRIAASPHGGHTAACREFLARRLAAAPELDALTRQMVALDSQEDNVFVTACDQELLWLNFTERAITKTIPGQPLPLTLPPWTIVAQPVTQPPGDHASSPKPSKETRDRTQ